MIQFNYTTGTIDSITLRDEIAEARRRFILAPIIIHHYNGRSHAGYCHTDDQDTAYSRYHRAQRKSQYGSRENGYLL